MSNSICFIDDNHISWNEDFTIIRLADHFYSCCMAASTLDALVSRLSLQEDNMGCGVVPDPFSKDNIVYQKYREGIMFQKDKAAMFFSYKTFEKLVVTFSQARLKEKGISCELTDDGYLIGGGPVVFSSWQMEAIYGNMRAADNLDMSFGNTFVEFYQDKILITWQGTEYITYNLEQFAAMLDNWKKQVKENEE